MIKATIIFGGDATRYYNETSQLPSSEWLMDNGGVVKNIEFSTKAEYDAYVQGVSDAHLWDDYHILPNADEEPQPEVTIWMRLGVTVHGNKDDIENIIQGDSATLNRLLKRRSFDIDGEAYIPASVIEEYNKENQTDFDEEDIDFPTTYISQILSATYPNAPTGGCLTSCLWKKKVKTAIPAMSGTTCSTITRTVLVRSSARIRMFRKQTASFVKST